MARRREPERCSCGLGATYDACCARWSDAPAPTPELLMRSRYTAYARGDVAHLLRTWHPSTRPEPLVLDPEVRWTGLEVLATSGGGLLEVRGRVAFRARAVRRGRVEVLEEDSLFVREGGAWLYLSAELG
ncbi:MAG: hypothetical protein JWM64_454 [Frankiales bacterium]|nr:hypothetical protein [Frankiales bacterium]